MGLEIVEFVMSVEEKFNIDISDEEAEKAVTVADVHRLVQDKLGVTETLPAKLLPAARDAPVEALLASLPNWPPPERPIWDALYTLLVDDFDIPPHRITPDACFVDDLGMG